MKQIEAHNKITAVNWKILLTRSLRITAKILVAVVLIGCSGSPGSRAISWPGHSWFTRSA